MVVRHQLADQDWTSLKWIETDEVDQRRVEEKPAEEEERMTGVG